jgi:hypothetical protein
MISIRNPKDFWAGALYAAFGLAAILIALDYPTGTTSRMGPGYFPRALGILLIVIGAILMLRGIKDPGARIELGSFKPLVVVLGSIALFGLVAPYFGMVVATIVLVVVSSFASHEFRWREALIAAVFLAVFTVAAFGYGLDLQLPLWPAFVG